MCIIVKLSAFLTIFSLLVKLPSLSPDLGSTCQVEKPAPPATAQEVEQPAPIVAQPVKTDKITDGIWQWRRLITQYFPRDQWQNALEIASAEDGSGDPARTHLNHNNSMDYGLFMINSVHADLVNGDLESLKDPQTNVKIAFAIWSQQGNWSAWTTSHKLGL